MGILTYLKKLSIKLEKKNDSDFSIPVSKQKEIVNHFREPRDDIERSFYQYKCQMKRNKPYVSVFISIASLPLAIYYIVKRNKIISGSENCEAVFIAEGIPEHVIPDELRSKYEKWIISNDHGNILLREDKKFIKKLFFRYPFSWHLLLKCIIKIGYYRYEIERYHPAVIVVCGEYSFTSSILTEYCHSLGIKHYDIMHGEKYYYMRDSFFHFDHCYVWDEFYKKLFISLRAEKNQFIINTPRSMYFSKLRNVEKTVDYTYYLGCENNTALSNIARSLRTLIQQGNVVTVRLHPRYSDPKTIEKLFFDIPIEDNKTIDIETSVLRTKNAVSGYSTVLNQAYHNNVNVVIDDISDPAIYKKLAEVEYIMLNVDHKLLSEVLTERNSYEY